MPKHTSPISRLAIATAFASSLVTSGPVSAGVVTGNATEWTQLLNNAELINLTGQSAEQIRNQVTQIGKLAEQIQNSTSTPVFVSVSSSQ